MEPARKKIRLVKATSKYKSIDVVKKTDLLKKYAKKYKSMDPMKKTDLLQKNDEKYKSMDPMKKTDLLQKNDENYNKFLIHDTDCYISWFHNKINEGPYYVCSVSLFATDYSTENQSCYYKKINTSMLMKLCSRM